MTTVVVSVAASGDDAEGTPAGTFYSAATTTLICGSTSTGSSGVYALALRFASVPVPAGATVNSATLTVDVAGGSIAGSPAVTWYGVAQNSAAATSSLSDLTGRPLTSASVAWGPDQHTTGHQSQDVTGPVAEVLGRSGWASGHALMLQTRATANGAYAELTAYDGDPSNAATLTVDYTPAATTMSGAAAGGVSWSGSAGGSASHAGTTTGLAAWTGAASGRMTFAVTATVDGANVVLTWNDMSATYAVERDGSVVAWNVDALTYTDTPGDGEHTYRVGVLA